MSSPFNSVVILLLINNKAVSIKNPGILVLYFPISSNSVFSLIKLESNATAAMLESFLFAQKLIAVAAPILNNYKIILTK